MKHTLEALVELINKLDETVGLTPETMLEMQRAIGIERDKLKKYSIDNVCPECMEKVEQEELDMFGGLCENCTTYC